MKLKKVFKLEKIFDGIIGQICWEINFKKINLSFNLGEPKLLFETCKEDPEKDRQLRKYTTVKGQWFFWVFDAYWKLSVLDISGENKLRAVTTSTDREKRRVISLLCGQKLKQMDVNHATGQTNLFFDLGAELNICRRNPKAQPVWLLYDNNDYCLSINGDGTYNYVPSSGTDTRPTIKNIPIPKDIIIGPKIN